MQAPRQRTSRQSGKTFATMRTLWRRLFKEVISDTYVLLREPKPCCFFTALFALHMCCYIISELFAPRISDTHLVPAERCRRSPYDAEIDDCTFCFRMPHDTRYGGFSYCEYPVRVLFQMTEKRMDDKDKPTDVFKVLLNVELLYSGEPDGFWYEDTSALLHIKVKCKKTADGLACSPVPILMLERIKYPFFMVRVQVLNISYLKKFGVTRVMLKVINQNKYFCRVWLYVKCILSLSSGIMLYMFLERMKAAERPATFFEKILRLLLCTLLVQNMPLEQTLTGMGLPFGTPLSVLTSGVFFSTLFISWLVYACECLPPTAVNPTLTTQQRVRYSFYYVIFCTLLITYNMYDTAMRSINPYYNTGDGLYDSITVINAVSGSIAFSYVLNVQLGAWRAGRVHILIDSFHNPSQMRDRRLLGMLFLGFLCALHGAGTFVLSEINNTQYVLASWKWLDMETTLQGKSYYYICVYFTWTMYVHMLIMMYLPERAVPQQPSAVPQQPNAVPQQPRVVPQRPMVDGPMVQPIIHKKQKVK